MTKLVYVAQAIDQANGNVGPVDSVARALTLHGHILFRPPGAFQLVRQYVDGVDPRLEQVNRRALELCDVLVAVLPRGVPTVGLPREIEACSQAGKPWAVVTDIERSYSLTDADATFPLDVHADEVACWVDKQPDTPRSQTHPQPLQFAKAGGYDGVLPTRTYDGDAGYDLYAAARVLIPSGQFRDVPCGIKVALPDGYWGRIIGRSSTLRTRQLLVSEGVIDTGWRGELFAGVQNVGERSATIEQGDRVAQLILTNNCAPQFRPVWVSGAEFADIPGDGRGDRGFGSTGK